MSEFDAIFDSQNNQDPSEQSSVREQPPEVEISREDRQKIIFTRLQLKTQILRWKETFPQQLSVYDYKMQNLDSLSNGELEELLDELSMAVSTRNSSGLTKMFYYTGAEVFEKGGVMLGFKIQGVANALMQNQAISHCLDEIMLKYEKSLYTPPELRLAYLTMQSIITLHKLNSNQDVINSAMNKKVAPEIATKYKDL